jgi:hypothetical protein
MERDEQRDAPVSLRRISVAALLLAALLVPAATADNTPDHYLLGAVPAHGHGPDGNGPPGPDGNGPPGPGGAPHAAAGPAGTSNLTYHGGPVMRTNTTYTIFWSPGGAISSTYQSLINGYFQNVADASGASSNVYASDTQYYDNTGSIAYQSHFGGTYVDTSAIPNNPACLSQYQAIGYVTSGGCVLDSDVENLVAADAAKNGWPNGGNSLFLVFTPKNVGSCWDTTSKTCAFNYYCAYHSDFSTNAGSFLYANQPYTDTSGVIPSGAQVCSEGVFPNGDFADATISVASHEHNEAITDPYGSAWYDASGNENGDKCAWNFGNAIGSTPNGAYNQAIGTGKYYLQQEWSNASSGCVLTYGASAPAPTITNVSPTTGVVGTGVTITGTNLASATSVKFNATSATFTADPGGASISTTVPSGATTGTLTVTTPGGTANGGTFTVTAPDFTIDVQPASQTITRGSSASYSVTITRLNGFTGSVKLAIGSLPGGPNGPSASFNPGTISNPGTTSTLTISTKNNGKTGIFNFTVSGTSGGLKHTDTASLTVH